MKKKEVEPKVSDFPKNVDNPFLKEMIETMEHGTKRKLVTPSNKELIQTVVNDSTGEVSGHTAFMQFVEVDEKQFAKLYLSNIAAFWDLSKPAIKVFTYIISNIRPNQDRLYFILEECIEYTGYKSKTMIFNGLAALLENRIIARGRTSFEFFINPMVAFNGNRITFAKTYVKKKAKQQFNDKQLDLFRLEDKSFKHLKSFAEKNNLLESKQGPQEAKE